MLLNKILEKKSKIGVFGLGYIGLPRCIQFAKKNFKVLGFDNDRKKLEKLKNKKSYLTTVQNKDLIALNKSKFFPTNDLKLVKTLDIIIICLPTPLKNNKPDLSYLRKTLKSIIQYLKEDQLIVLESTSYPGTTEEEIIRPLKSKFKIGKNFFICFSPERDDPGRLIDTYKINRLISGKSSKCKNLGSKLYKQIFKNVKIMNTIEEAEMSKIYENVYRAINIGLVNELKKICHKMNIDFFKVIEGAKTKPYGFKAFYPGPGLGGHCIPIDPFYLTWKAKKFGITSKFIELSGEINNSMPNWIVLNIEKYFKNTKSQIKNKKALILGVAYKKNINDTREAPSLKIIDLLIKKKCKVHYSDPYIKKLKKFRNYKFQNLKSINLSKKNLKFYDFVVLVTDHDKFDKKKILNNAKLIFDTRNFFKFNKSDKVISL